MSSLILRVSIATWTSVEPVSLSFLPCLLVQCQPPYCKESVLTACGWVRGEPGPDALIFVFAALDDVVVSTEALETGTPDPELLTPEVLAPELLAPELPAPDPPEAGANEAALAELFVVPVDAAVPVLVVAVNERAWTAEPVAFMV